eukprot:759802-Hanusia_phi.AAC.4
MRARSKPLFSDEGLACMVGLPSSSTNSSSPNSPPLPCRCSTIFRCPSSPPTSSSCPMANSRERLRSNPPGRCSSSSAACSIVTQ